MNGASRRASSASTGSCTRSDELSRLVETDAEDRRVRAHATGVRPVVAVERPLEVLGGDERNRTATVAEGEQRDLGAFEKLLDDDVTDAL